MFVFPLYHYIEFLEPEHTFLLPVRLHLLWIPFTYFFFHRTMALDRRHLLQRLEVVERQLLLARGYVQAYELMRAQLRTALEQQLESDGEDPDSEPGASASNAGAQVEPGAGAGAHVEPGAGAHVDVEPGAGAHVEPGAGDDEGSPSVEMYCGHCGGTEFLKLGHLCQFCIVKSKRKHRHA